MSGPDVPPGPQSTAVDPETGAPRGVATLRNNVTGETRRVWEDETHAHLTQTAPNGAQLWSSERGTTLGFYTDEEGNTRRRFYSDNEVFALRGAGAAGNNLDFLGNPRGGEISRTRTTENRANIAESTRGLAFARTLANVATAGLAGRIEQHEMEALGLGGAAEHAQAVADLESGNPVETFLGNVAAAGLTLAGTGVGGGARTLSSALTTRGLLGLGARARAATTAALGGTAPGAVRGFAANIAGRAVGAAVVDIPLSMQFTAATLADTNQPLTAEAFISRGAWDVGLGMAFETALPVLGGIARATRRIVPAITGSILASSIGGVGGAAAGSLGANFAARAGRNRASRAMAGTHGRKAARAAAEAADDAAQFVSPQRLANLSADEARDLAGRIASREELLVSQGRRAPEMAAEARRILAESDRLPGLAARLDSGAGAVSSGIRNLAREIAPSGNLRRGALAAADAQRLSFSEAADVANASVDLRLSQLQRELGADGVSAGIIGRARNAILGGANSAGVTPPSAVRRELIDLRARVMDQVAGDSDGAMRQILITERVDELLRNRRIWGDAVVEANSRLLRQMDGVVAEHGGALSEFLEAGDITGLATRGSGESVENLRSSLARMEGLLQGPGWAEQRKALKDSIKAVDGYIDDAEFASRLQRAGVNHVSDNPIARSVGSLEMALDKTRGGLEEIVESRMAAYEANLEMLRAMEGGKEAVRSAIRGRSLTIPRIGIFAARNMNEKQSREEFERISTQISHLSSNPGALEANLEESLGLLSDTNSELADNTGSTLVKGVHYMAQNVPQSPTFLFTGALTSVSLSAVEVFNERWHALQDPVSLMYAAAQGSLTSESVEAVQTVMPQTFAQLQLSVVEVLSEAAAEGEEIPYLTLHSLSRLLGSSLDASSDPEFIMALQQGDAEAQQEEDQRRGPRRSSREPGFSRQAMTVTARVEQL